MPEDKAARNGVSQGEHGKIRLGIAGEDLTRELAAQLQTRVKSGVVVQQVQPGSPAQRAGIKRGDVIFRINGEDIKSMRSFSKLAEGFKHGDVLRVMLDRKGDQVFVLVKLPKQRKKDDN